MLITQKAAQFFRRKFNEAGVDPKEGLIKQRFFGKTDLYTMYWSFESKTGNRYVLEFDYDIEAPQRMSIPSPFVECIRTKYKLFSGRSSRILPTQEEAWEWIEEALKEG